MDDIETKPSEAVPPPAHGSAAQPWIEEPTRAGWWAYRVREERGAMQVKIEDSGIWFWMWGLWMCSPLAWGAEWTGPFDSEEATNEAWPQSDQALPQGGAKKGNDEH